MEDTTGRVITPMVNHHLQQISFSRIRISWETWSRRLYHLSSSYITSGKIILRILLVWMMSMLTILKEITRWGSPTPQTWLREPSKKKRLAWKSNSKKSRDQCSSTSSPMSRKPWTWEELEVTATRLHSLASQSSLIIPIKWPKTTKQCSTLTTSTSAATTILPTHLWTIEAVSTVQPEVSSALKWKEAAIIREGTQLWVQHRDLRERSVLLIWMVRIRLMRSVSGRYGSQELSVSQQGNLRWVEDSDRIEFQL